MNSVPYSDWGLIPKYGANDFQNKQWIKRSTDQDVRLGELGCILCAEAGCQTQDPRFKTQNPKPKIQSPIPNPQPNSGACRPIRLIVLEWGLILMLCP